MSFFFFLFCVCLYFLFFLCGVLYLTYIHHPNVFYQIPGSLCENVFF